jgi:hypothetical protein
VQCWDTRSGSELGNLLHSPMSSLSCPSLHKNSQHSKKSTKHHLLLGKIGMYEYEFLRLHDGREWTEVITIPSDVGYFTLKLCT